MNDVFEMKFMHLPINNFLCIFKVIKRYMMISDMIIEIKYININPLDMQLYYVPYFTLRFIKVH